jgi:Ca-activated chloride channel family protein
VRGAADYRAGDYADAARAFAQGGGARAQYNLGNALARQGEYREAIAAYQRALQQEPKFADARANLDAVEAWLKKHAPPPRRQSGQGQSNPNGRSGAGSPQSEARRSAPGSAGNQGQNPQPQTTPGSSADQRGSASNPSAASGGSNGDSDAGNDPGGASATEAERQRRQSEQAAQGLEHELQGAHGGHSKPGTGSPHAFALGESPPDDEANFDASQRAILRSVPDDPGALLRRKFRLEWEQRNGQQQENRQ